jgi:hypothetical protein
MRPVRCVIAAGQVPGDDEDADVARMWDVVDEMCLCRKGCACRSGRQHDVGAACGDGSNALRSLVQRGNPAFGDKGKKSFP